jgi:hypothetical protein
MWRETMSPNAVCGHLEKRIYEIRELVRGPTIANLKERRQNPTVVLPPPSELSYSFPTLAPPRTLFSCDDVAMEKFWSSVLEPLAQLRDGPRRRVLFVSPSTKSRQVGQTSHKNLLMSQLRYLHRSTGRLPTLSGLCQSLGRSDEFLTATTGAPGDNEFLRDVGGVVGSSMAPHILAGFREKWRRSPADADLDIRFVENRGEERAFTNDRDALRSLVGSVVHSIFHPANKSARSQLAYSRVWKVKGKNVLRVQATVRVRRALTAVFGDISSFTSSLSNIWMVLFAAIHMISEQAGGLKDVTLIVAVGPCLCEVQLLDTLRLYVYLAFLMPVYDLVVADTFFSVGGLLGVAGINTVANVVFASFQLALATLLLRHYEVRYRPQNGGDDYFAQIDGQDPLRVMEAARTARLLIEQYIGRHSEYSLESVPFRYVWKGTLFCLPLFCKKFIRLDWDRIGNTITVTWTSQYNVPLFGLLLEGPRATRRSDFDVRAQGYFASLKSTLPWIPRQDVLISTFVMLFYLLVCPYKPAAPGRTILSRPLWMGRSEEGLTDAAETIVMNTQIALDSHGALAVRHREDLCLLLAKRDRLAHAITLETGTPTPLWLSSKEQAQLLSVRMPEVQHFPAPSCPVLVSRLFVALYSARLWIEAVSPYH